MIDVCKIAYLTAILDIRHIEFLEIVLPCKTKLGSITNYQYVTIKQPYNVDNAKKLVQTAILGGLIFKGYVQWV